jgi:hypothetical protein
LKQINISNKGLPSRNVGINPEELHTPTSTPQNPKGDDGDKKNKLEFDKVFSKNEAWQKADIMFQKLLKRKLMFIGKIIETPSI